MGQHIINTALLHALNPGYVEALAKGERWALDHARRVESINNGEPAGMRRSFDGRRRKWCGDSCSHRQGCITCTLPDDTEVVKLHRQNNGYHDSKEQDLKGTKDRRRNRRRQSRSSNYSGDGTDDDFI